MWFLNSYPVSWWFPCLEYVECYISKRAHNVHVESDLGYGHGDKTKDYTENRETEKSAGSWKLLSLYSPHVGAMSQRQMKRPVLSRGLII